MEYLLKMIAPRYVPAFSALKERMKVERMTLPVLLVPAPPPSKWTLVHQ
jgi:hypothetical protein